MKSRYCTLMPINKHIKISDYYGWYQKRDNSYLINTEPYKK